MDHKWWEKTKPASVNPLCKTRDCSLKKEDVDKTGKVQRKATITLNMRYYERVNSLMIRNAYTGK